MFDEIEVLLKLARHGDEPAIEKLIEYGICYNGLYVGRCAAHLSWRQLREIAA